MTSPNKLAKLLETPSKPIRPLNKPNSRTATEVKVEQFIPEDPAESGHSNQVVQVKKRAVKTKLYNPQRTHILRLTFTITIFDKTFAFPHLALKQNYINLHKIEAILAN